ncbi:MAG: four helix bundle protein [Candidatus Cloacimonadota bacterium]|nr:four helix bundle protein [Candidatus Cloacimonadota bacterium]
MEDIRDLKVYIEALNFSNLIWKICKGWDNFSKRTVGIQLVRAADSISANIAEGYGRFHYKENLKFCYYARGSFEETKDWLRKAYTRDLIIGKEKDNIENFLIPFVKQLNAYINYIKNCMNSKPSSTS